MSSQVATMTGPGGLPSTPPPGPDLNYPAQTAWTDHMDADQPTDNTISLPQNPTTRDQTFVSSQTSINTSYQQQQAVSNLLEAIRHAQTANAPQTNQTSGLPLYPEASNIVPISDAEVQEHTALGDIESGSAPTNSQGFGNNQLPLDSSVEVPTFPPPAYTPAQNMALTMDGFSHPEPSRSGPSIQDRREVEAFAKIEFQDGNYYITTWQCELGRDARAYRDAVLRAEEIKNNPAAAQSSSGAVSRPSERVRQYVDSQVQGSVISEAGGFGGIDQAPKTEDPKLDGHGYPSHSSQVSSSDVVRPQEVLYHPPAVPFDYHRNAEMQARALDPDLEQPAPVTDDHVPDPDQCPIIPIHSMSDSTQDEIKDHKSISRRHVRIEWDFDAECFKLKVLGRNGAFVDGQLLEEGASKELRSGSHIQISGIEMTFRLPTLKAELLSEESGDEVENHALLRQSTSLASDDALETAQGLQKTQLALANSAAQAFQTPLVGPDGNPIVRKRGPGRPPKDGHMSQREKKLLKKAIEMAEAKAANGGRTPPPMATARGKPSKPPTKDELAKAEAKPEKRKYIKRKRDGEDADVLPSIEGGEDGIDSNEDKPPNKKSRASKSPSPEYPPLASLTEDQLQRPNEPYAKVIYDLLMEISPKALPLKGVYRMIKMRYPFFVYRVDSDGWQSSVRHNLNQEHEKLFDKGDKEGKGYAWRAIPGAMRKEERKKAAPATSTSKPKPAAHHNPPPQKPPHHQPPMHWASSQPYPPQYWPQSQQAPYPPQSNGMPYLGSIPPPSSGQQILTSPNGVPSQHRPPSSHVSTGQPLVNHSYPPPTHPALPGLPQQSHAPTASNPGTAAPNMPCTLEGIIAIRKFEENMYDQVRQGSNPQSLEYWQQVFSSVKKRLLHGQPASIMPSGETQEELMIMGHLKTIRDRFRNVNFIGFGERRGTPPVHPAGPVLSGNANAGDSAASTGSPQITAKSACLVNVDGEVATTVATNGDKERSKTASPLPPSTSLTNQDGQPVESTTDDKPPLDSTQVA